MTEIKNDVTYQQAPNPVALDPFPFLILDVTNGISYPPRLRDALAQWHDDLQFIVVAEGVINVETPAGRFACSKGQGVFINSRTLHRVTGTQGSISMSFVFPAKALGFFPGSVMYECGVAPFIGVEAQPVVYFDLSQSWHSNVLEHLLRARSLYISDHESDIQKYRIATEILCAWTEYISNTCPLPVSQQERLMNTRMRAFITFIEEHYPEQLRLSDIAASANVSKTECLRCFREMLNMTPIAYLNSYRLEEAIKRICEGNLSLTQIALTCGYSSLSYFSKSFKSQFGMSPREYMRALHKTSLDD